MDVPNSKAIPPQPDYWVRKLTVQDAPEVNALFTSVRFELAQRGLDLWQHGYPNPAQQLADIEAGNMWGMGQDRLTTAVTLDFHATPQYREVNWRIPAERPLIIHRLATRASSQGQGWGHRMLEFCERQANVFGADAIRLDTYLINSRNMQFYRKRGYSEVPERVYFTPQAWPFACFEKAVAQD